MISRIADFKSMQEPKQGLESRNFRSFGAAERRLAINSRNLWCWRSTRRSQRNSNCMLPSLVFLPVSDVPRHLCSALPSHSSSSLIMAIHQPCWRGAVKAPKQRALDLLAVSSYEQCGVKNLFLYQ
ncbi:hypothetical protein PM082_014909 [Marasmius tenuissimus]|nr:hypothetical protein PM082_014909 [Marasmius tenuissimus]